MIEELLQVVGMPWELFNRAPGLTVFGRPASWTRVRAIEALLALPEMTEEMR
jgi:hypothetical protein